MSFSKTIFCSNTLDLYLIKPRAEIKTEYKSFTIKLIVTSLHAHYIYIYFLKMIPDNDIHINILIGVRKIVMMSFVNDNVTGWR